MLNKTRNQTLTKEEKKKELARRFIIKEGHGTASNSCYWAVCFDKDLNIYTALVSFGGAGGSSASYYQITGDIFNQVGKFEDDDYKSERLIETGRLLYRCDSSKYAPDVERVLDGNWKNLCFWFDWKWETR